DAPRRCRSGTHDAPACVPGSGHAGRHRGADVPRGGRGAGLSDRDRDVAAVPRPCPAAPRPRPLRARARVREGGGMNCGDVRAKLHAYVDGELSVSEITDIDGHCVECRDCAALARAEREFRQLLRRQPREAAPPELRARIVSRVRRESVVALGRRWLLAPIAAAVGGVFVLVLLPARTPPPLVAELVDKHIAYSQIDRPAELTSADPREVTEWFQARAGMRVTVPDYSPSGIHLAGARLAEAHERKAAYLLYEK